MTNSSSKALPAFICALLSANPLHRQTYLAMLIADYLLLAGIDLAIVYSAFY